MSFPQLSPDSRDVFFEDGHGVLELTQGLVLWFDATDKDKLIDGRGPWSAVFTGRGWYALRALRGANATRQYAHRVIMGASSGEWVSFLESPRNGVIDCRRTNLARVHPITLRKERVHAAR